MTQLPRLEARIGAQERMTTILHARIEELSEDMTASFRQQVDYQIKFEHMIEDRFTKIEADLGTVKADLNTVKADLSAVKEDVGTIKENMTAQEARILDAFKQLLTVIDSRLPPSPRQE